MSSECLTPPAPLWNPDAMRALLPLLLASVMLAGQMSCSPPPAAYPYTPLVTQRRATLQQDLLQLLPSHQQNRQAARQEAAWLADTAYKAAAGISRVNGSRFPGWAGNALINAHLQDRGLCWHYQHDLFRELRRKPLHYFRLGCCVRDKGKLREHNCVYIAAAQGTWPHAWVLDAWLWNGRLKVSNAATLNQNRWDDLPYVCTILSLGYPEGHAFPVEHWLSVRCYDGLYNFCHTDAARCSSQYRRMYENIRRGQQEHPGAPTNY